MSEPVIVREYRETDESAWLAVWGQVAVTSWAWAMLHHRKPRYKRPAVELVATAADGGLAGFLDVEVESVPGELGYAKDSCCGFAWELGVLPAWRGRGVARALVAAAEPCLVARGVRRMEFWSADERAQAFYRHLNMRELERHWQFFLGLPDEIRARLKSDGVGIFTAYGSCPIDRLDQIKTANRVRLDPPEEPHMCVGFDHRF
jgi:GNAT superfamily N-acetyltransferase